MVVSFWVALPLGRYELQRAVFMEAVERESFVQGASRERQQLERSGDEGMIELTLSRRPLSRWLVGQIRYARGPRR